MKWFIPTFHRKKSKLFLNKITVKNKLWAIKYYYDF